MLRFKGYCAENKVKQSEIAEILNITVQSANRKLNGKEPFTLEQVKTLCEHYSISADEYFV
jgi:transcriptional regulator with XRE-family HTH domain